MQPANDQGGIHSLAELKLLKLLQEELNRRTAQLQSSVTASRPTPEQLAELQALSKEQGQLADMVLDLIQAAATDDAALPLPDSEGAKKPEDGKMAPQSDKDSLDDALLRDLM
jgi:hypothetical protein